MLSTKKFGVKILVDNRTGINMKNKELTQSILHQLVLYHPTTGLFTKPDGSYLKLYISNGYYRVSLGGYGQHRVHRLAFLFMEGKWPTDMIDHVDVNKLNNTWLNLRHATCSQNAQNQRSTRDSSKTRLLGVRANGKKFQARITFESVVTLIGTFATVEEAHEAYVKVKRELHLFGEL